MDNEALIKKYLPKFVDNLKAKFKHKKEEDAKVRPGKAVKFFMLDNTGRASIQSIGIYIGQYKNKHVVRYNPNITDRTDPRYIKTILDIESKVTRLNSVADKKDFAGLCNKIISLIDKGFFIIDNKNKVQPSTTNVPGMDVSPSWYMKSFYLSVYQAPTSDIIVTADDISDYDNSYTAVNIAEKMAAYGISNTGKVVHGGGREIKHDSKDIMEQFLLNINHNFFSDVKNLYNRYIVAKSAQMTNSIEDKMRYAIKLKELKNMVYDEIINSINSNNFNNIYAAGNSGSDNNERRKEQLNHILSTYSSAKRKGPKSKGYEDRVAKEIRERRFESLNNISYFGAGGSAISHDNTDIQNKERIEDIYNIEHYSEQILMLYNSLIIVDKISTYSNEMRTFMESTDVMWDKFKCSVEEAKNK